MLESKNHNITNHSYKTHHGVIDIYKLIVPLDPLAMAMMYTIVVIFVIYYVLHVICQSTSSTIVINVISTSDGIPESSQCYPTVTTQCTFRSAWEACVTYSSPVVKCIIELPTRQLIAMDVNTFDSLYLTDTSNIQINGNLAKVINNIHETSMSSLWAKEKYTNQHDFEEDYQIPRRQLTHENNENKNNFINILFDENKEIEEEKKKLYQSSSSSNTPTNQLISYVVSIKSITTGPILQLFNFTISQFGNKIEIENDDGVTIDVTEDGGAIELNGNVYFLAEHMNISNNNGYYGGAIQFSYNALPIIIRNSTFDDNTAYHRGGGISLLYACSQFLMEYCSFSNNIATYTYSYGGGIYVGLNVTNVTVQFNHWQRNTAFYGGSIFLLYNTSNVEITNSYFQENSDIEKGGFIYGSRYVSNITITKNTFINGSANNRGGCIAWFRGNHNIYITQNVFQGCTSKYYGGALYFAYYNHHIYVIDNIFHNCSASLFVGVILMEFYNAYLYFQHNQFYNSISSDMAGNFDIYQGNSFIFIEDCLFDNSQSLDHPMSGSAVYLFARNLNITISRCVIQHQHGNNGGAIIIKSHNTGIIIEDTIITDIIGMYGTGIYVESYNQDIFISNVTIIKCTSQGNGGGIYIYENNNNIRIVSSQIVKNRVGGSGGGIAISSNNNEVYIAGCNISDNQAILNGGGIFMQNQNNFLFLLDLQGYEDSFIVQTEHPYEGGKPASDDEPFIILSKYIDIPEAHQFIIEFVPYTNINDDVDIIYIYTDLTMMNIIFSSANGLFPGADLPPLVVSSSTLYVVFEDHVFDYDATTYEDNRYGFKMYITPIITNSSSPTILQRNQAQLGGALFQFSGNLNSLVANTWMIGNQASSGGAYYLRDANVFFSMFQSLFKDNYATENGGAMALLSFHYGSIFDNVVMRNNSCSVNGGAIYSNSQNGIGILSSGNEIIYNQCIFEENHAIEIGGGIYLETGNVISIVESYFQKQHVDQGLGGAIYASQANIITIVNTTFANNSANICGGSIGIEQEKNLVTIEDTSFVYNLAMTNGGAICVLDASQLDFQGSITMSGNVAKLGGGAIFLSSAPMWTYNNPKTFLINQNQANYGSAIFIIGLLSSSTSMQYLQIVNNSALVGGTLYWIYDAKKMPSAPPGYNSSTNIWKGNQAHYGVQIGTQGVKLIGPKVYEVMVYNENLNPYLTYHLEDYYGSFIPINGTTAFYPQINTSLIANCRGNIASLSGSDTIGNGVTANNGLAIFDELKANCAPNGSLHITVEAMLGTDLGLPASDASYYYIHTNTELQFRNCTIGEYEKNGQCYLCPAGTYNLQTNAQTCTSCNGVSGFEFCEGNEIMISNGYWRRYSFTASVQSCPYSSNCIGGNNTGDTLCAEGSSGPLCAVCLEGYYLDGVICVSCSGSGAFNSNLIAFLVIFGFLAIVAIYIYVFYRDIFNVEVNANNNPDKRSSVELNSLHDGKFQNQNQREDSSSSSSSISKEGEEQERELTEWELTWLWFKGKYSQMMVKVKIIVSTFQVVISSADVLSVSFPYSFTTLLNSFSFLNFSLSSVFPIGCSNNYSFINTLILTTLSPIGLAFLLLIGFVSEFRYQMYSLNQKKKKSNYQEKSGERLEVYETLRDKYLNYFFYLTYLVLPSVTTTIFQMYLCTNIDPDNETPDDTNYYLSADMNISCDSELYNRGVAYASIMILVYPIGIPAMYLFLLYQNKEELLHRNDDDDVKEGTESPEKESEQVEVMKNPLLPDDHHDAIESSKSVSPSIDLTSLPNLSIAKPTEENELSSSAARLAFLWEAYLPEYWYWEVIETTRRLVLTAVLSVCSTGTSQQSVLSILLALLYIKLYSFYNPYADDSGNILAETGQYQIFFTFFCSMVILNQLVDSELIGLIGALLVLINLSVVFLSFYFELEEYYTEEEETKATKHDQQVDEDSTLKKLIMNMKSWVYQSRYTHGVTSRVLNKNIKATSKVTAAYVKAIKQKHQKEKNKTSSSSSSSSSHEKQEESTKTMFTRIEDNRTIQQIALSNLAKTRDSDDESDEDINL